MYNNNMNNYAFISLLYPNKKGEWTYLEGAILTALGLRKQNTKFKIICMVTPDITDDVNNKLKIVYDKVFIVDYISPLETAGIKINGNIFDKTIYENKNSYNDMCNIFTKLHIFDYKKFPYDKVLFIDNDLIPLENFDDLFNIDVPAGWLEKILELETKQGDKYTRVWGTYNNIKHGELIPKELTDIYKEPGRDINGGLLLIKPDNIIFNNMINELKKPINEWSNEKFEKKGTIDFNRNFTLKYVLPEQSFITQYFSGEWKMIDGKYCAWGKYNDEKIYGMHMAGLKYIIKGKWETYKTWMVQIPVNDGFNEITNNVIIWGFEKFPKLKDFLINNLFIYFADKLINLKDIDAFIYLHLTNHQKNIFDIIS